MTTDQPDSERSEETDWQTPAEPSSQPAFGWIQSAASDAEPKLAFVPPSSQPERESGAEELPLPLVPPDSTRTVSVKLRRVESPQERISEEPKRRNLPKPIPALTADDATKFWLQVHRTESCWIWEGSVMGNGYGRFYRIHKEGWPAHRVAFELARRTKLDSLTILDHLCRNRRCVNPDHLEPVSETENILRGTGWGAANAMKKTCPKGHLYDGVNYRGYRLCGTCKRETDRIAAERYRNKKRATK